MKHELRKELRFFTVFPSVVKVGEKSRITIESHHHIHPFRQDKYTVRVVPKERKDFPRDPEYRFDKEKDAFNQYEIEIKDKKAVIEYEFKDEQEYIIAFIDDKGQFELKFSVYALYEDLYNTMPYRGDVHLHTKESDGDATIAEAPAAYREHGFDFICITDHHKYYPSVEAKKVYDGVNTGIKIFPGEEVHNADAGFFHIVNFNGGYSVNELLDKDYQATFNEIKELAKTLDLPDDVDAVGYAFRKWICDNIRKSGGKAVLAHPYWTIHNQYHTETHMSKLLLKNGVFDIFDVLTGCNYAETQLAVGLYNELCIEGLQMPITGSSDAHSHDIQTHLFLTHSTVVFAESEDDIVDAIMDKKSVAVQQFPDENPRVFGTFRQIKYTLYLLDNYFPVYELYYTKDLGALMRAYADYGECANVINAVNEKAQDYRNKFFGREKV